MKKKNAEELIKKDQIATNQQNITFAAINRLFKESMNCESSIEVAKICLSVAQEITGSRFGSVAEVNSKGRFDTLALSDPGWEECRVVANDPVSILNDMEVRGIWRAALESKHGIIINDPANHPLKVGVPKGHPPLKSFLGIPFQHKNFKGMIGIANKAGGYTEADREIIEALALSFGEVINSKRAEEKLRDSEEQYRILFENAPIMLGVIDEEGNYIEVNDSVFNMLGYTNEYLQSKNAFSLIHADDQKEILDHFTDLKKTGSGEVVYRFQHKDGSYRYIQSKAVKIVETNTYFIYSDDITERKQAEEKLRKSKELLLEAQQIAHIAHWTFDPATGMPWWSEELYRIYGRDPADGPLPYSEHPKLVHPDDWDWFDATVQATAKDGKPFDIFLRIMRPDGSVRIINSICQPLLDDKGAVVEMRGTIQDVTQHMLAEEALRMSEEKYSSIIRDTLDGFGLSDLEGNILEVNDSMCSILGYTRDELTKLRIADIEYQESQAQTKEHLHNIFKRGFDDFESKLKHKNGSVLDVIVQARISADKKFIHAFFKDITERKRAENALQKSEERFSSAFHRSPAGLTVTRLADGKFIDANKSFLDMFGFTREEVIGSNSIELNILSSQARADIVKAQIEAEGVRNFEVEARTKSGEALIVLISSTFIEEDGELYHITTLIDISERKRAEEALLLSQKRYQSLFSNSPVPLWEEDFSEVKKYIDSLKKRRVKDFRKYFKNNPDKVSECAQLVKITDVNNAVLKLHEADSKDELFKGLSSIFTDRSYEVFIEELVAIAEGKSECAFEAQVKTLQGKAKEVFLVWMVVPDYEDTLEKVYLSTSDITERKENEIIIQQNLKEKVVLLQEIHHRVKNNLQIMSSILNLQASKVDDEQIADILKESRSRIRSMSIVHELMYKDQDFTQINIKHYIRKLIESLIRLFGIDMGQITIREHCEDVKIDLNKAIPCGMIINEFISNAMKHAFTDGRKGSIDVGLRKKSGKIHMSVGDDGIALPAGFETSNSTSLGMTLIADLTQQLGGKLNVSQNDGFKVFEIVFTADNVKARGKSGQDRE